MCVHWDLGVNQYNPSSANITHFLIHHCESKDCRRTKWWYWYKVRTLGRNSSRKKSLLNQWEGKRCPVKFSNHPLKSLIKSSTFSLQTERGLMRMTHCYTNKCGNRSRLASFPGPHHFWLQEEHKRLNLGESGNEARSRLFVGREWSSWLSFWEVT